MPEEKAVLGSVRFGRFELSADTGELRKDGVRLKLSGQAIQVLTILATNPGKLVTREELQQKLWPGASYGDPEHGLNAAVNKLREALCDSATEPKYIETVPGRGYRFIAVLESESGPPEPGPPQPEPRRMPPPWWKSKATVAAVMAVVVGFFLLWVRARIQSSPAKPITSIAVLPLENLSGDPAQEYFAEGMTDELITDLAQFSDLRVTSRSSAMQYRGTKKRIPEIGRELNVDAVVEGTVSRADGRVRIRVQLIRTADDRHLWAQAFEREYRDVLVLQSDVARGIAEQVRVKLDQGRSAPRLSRDRPIKPEAYEAYLNGLYFFARRTRENNAKAVAYFRQAIQLDSDSAPAYAGLAEAYSESMFYDEPTVAVTSNARAAAVKALAIDPNVAEAHLSMASVLDLFDWNWEEADKEYRRAIELNPSFSRAHQFYSLYLVGMGRFNEAISEARLAQQLDPVSPFVYASGCLVSYYARQDDQAMDQCRRALEIDPNFAIAHGNLVNIYWTEKQYDRAIDEDAKWGSLHHFAPDVTKTLLQAYKDGGIKGYSQKILDLDSQGADLDMDEMARAACYDELGQHAKALDHLEKAFAERDPWMRFLAVDPGWGEELRAEPRFQKLVRDVREAAIVQP